MTALLELTGISKTFPGVQALNGVDLSIERGEIHALLGENGAGKSTLVNVIGGIVLPDAGQMVIDGRPIYPRSARDSIRDGIGVIHQELSVIASLSVSENISLGRLPTRGPLVEWSTARKRASTILDRLGANIDPSALAGSLSTGAQQQVEIARALAAEPKLLVMDEPTSALSVNEANVLLVMIRALANSGLTVIYISHRLEEIRQIADRLTVLRDGRVQLTTDTQSITPAGIVEAMIGRSLSRSTRQSGMRMTGAPAIAVEGLTTARINNVSLTVRAGEVLGIAGLLGSGRTALLRALCGLDQVTSGRILLDGRPVHFSSPVDSARHRVFLVPEDRKGQGLVLNMSVADNMTLPALGRISTTGFVDRTRQRSIAKSFIDKLGIKTPSSDQRVGYLSGGNQQKVVLARWLGMQPRVMLLDQPTRGLDIGAKEEVYELIRQLKEAEVAVVFVATEIPELLTVADRILVLSAGAIAKEMGSAGTTENEIFMASVRGAA